MPFDELPARLAEVRERIAASTRRGGRGQTVTLVAVTKTHGADAVGAVYRAGVHDCGENRVQEALAKMGDVDVPVRWHLIGHLQRNKVKSLDSFAMLHALDSARLADAINEYAVRRARPVEVLLQVNPAGEQSKGGFASKDVRAEAERLVMLPGLRVRGVMTMAPLGADDRVLRSVFAAARTAREMVRDAGHPAELLSMGMSNDYEIAIEEGATHVRLGTVLFGARAA